MHVDVTLQGIPRGTQASGRGWAPLDGLGAMCVHSAHRLPAGGSR